MIQSNEDPWSGRSRRRISGFWTQPATGAGTFGLILLCFVLPFALYKCKGTTIARESGYELALGISVSEEASGRLAEFDGQPNLFVMLALFCATAGFGLAFIRSAAGSVSQLVFGCLGAVALLFFYRQLTVVFRPSSETNSFWDIDTSGLSAHPGIGLWICLGLFMAAAVLGVLRLRKK